MQMAALLKSRGVKAEYILDESGCITSGVVPGVSKAVALVGTAEKGYLTLELSVEGEGGHSSMPPRQDGHRDFEQCHRPPGAKSVSGQAGGAHGADVRGLWVRRWVFPMRFVFANQWLFRGLIKRKLGKSIYTNGAIADHLRGNGHPGRRKGKCLASEGHGPGQLQAFSRGYHRKRDAGMWSGRWMMIG